MPLTRTGGAAVLALLAFASQAWGQAAPAGCAELAPGSFEAAMLGCEDPGAGPGAPSDVAPPEVLEAIEAPLPTPLPEAYADAAVEDAASAEPALMPPHPAPDEALVEVFADWLSRHPLGETVDSTELRLLDEEDRPADLPDLPLGRRYAELDGMLVEVDAETGELLRLVRRMPELSDEEISPEPEVASSDDGADEAEAAEAEAAEREQEERDDHEEQTAERDRNEDEGDGDRDEGGRGEAQAFDIPNGHMPPPGSCSVWFPDRPAGHQPPPTSCDVAVPRGAVLIRG